VITRFAPSPTGYLHLGHVVNAIYVWGLARARGGRALLRIEDHDRIRSRPAFERTILEDLAWLGFVPDAGLNPVRRQSDSEAVYAEALATLQATHHVYACDCSRQDVARLRRFRLREPARPDKRRLPRGRARSDIRGAVGIAGCNRAIGCRMVRGSASSWMNKPSGSRIRRWG
jgi:glutamyl/glutaminyl-tRNA synthetase